MKTMTKHLVVLGAFSSLAGVSIGLGRVGTAAVFGLLAVLQLTNITWSWEHW